MTSLNAMCIMVLFVSHGAFGSSSESTGSSPPDRPVQYLYLKNGSTIRLDVTVLFHQDWFLMESRPAHINTTSIINTIRTSQHEDLSSRNAEIREWEEHDLNQFYKKFATDADKEKEDKVLASWEFEMKFVWCGVNEDEFRWSKETNSGGWIERRNHVRQKHRMEFYQRTYKNLWQRSRNKQVLDNYYHRLQEYEERMDKEREDKRRKRKIMRELANQADSEKDLVKRAALVTKLEEMMTPREPAPKPVTEPPTQSSPEPVTEPPATPEPAKGSPATPKPVTEPPADDEYSTASATTSESSSVKIDGEDYEMLS